MNNDFKGKIIFSDNYHSTIQNIKTFNKNASDKVTISKASNPDNQSDDDSKIEEISDYNEKKSISFDNLKKIEIPILAAYDESILELTSLEGKVRCIVHSTLLQTDKVFEPSNYVTLKFFTKSNLIKAKATNFSDVIQSDDISKAVNDEYIKERSWFLEKAAPPESLLFIDGSMFSGSETAGNFTLVKQLLKNECLPIFFVKNSESDIITKTFSFAKDFNSDLHWAYRTLKVGEYSRVFRYTSKEGRSKAMCFMKIFDNRSPVRIEFPYEAFQEGRYPESVFDMIYYQYLANGSQKNVQPRIIQVAEMYAREVLKSTNLYKEIDRMGLTQSMNETRW